MVVGGATSCYDHRKLPLPTPTSSTRIVPLPADLDLVGFVDLDAWRTMLDDDPRATLMAMLVGLGSLPRGGTSNALARDALANTRHLWFACRPSRFGCDDLVLVLSGNFGDFEPARSGPGYLGPLDRGQGWFAYRGPAKHRHDVSAVYLGVPDRLVLVGNAEVDAVERIIEGGAAPNELVVSERAALAVSARPAALAEALGSRLTQARRLLRRARSLAATVTAGAPAELVVELRVGFDDAAQAETARQAIELFARAATDAALDRPVLGLTLATDSAQVIVRLSFLRTLLEHTLPPRPTASDALEPDVAK